MLECIVQSWHTSLPNPPMAKTADSGEWIAYTSLSHGFQKHHHATPSLPGLIVLHAVCYPRLLARHVALDLITPHKTDCRTLHIMGQNTKTFWKGALEGQAY